MFVKARSGGAESPDHHNRLIPHGPRSATTRDRDCDGLEIRTTFGRDRNNGEDQLIDAAIEPGSSILELGCGTGRITRPLLALGHEVVAVDESPDMLARVTETETVCSTIAELRLERRFDLVLMMSYLINVPDDDERHRLLRTCALHTRPGGSVILQQQIPGMLRGPSVRESEQRRMVVSDVEELPGNRQAATLTHTVGGRTWSQRVLTQNLSEDELTTQLAEVGLRRTGYLTPDQSWVQARRDD